MKIYFLSFFFFLSAFSYSTARLFNPSKLRMASRPFARFVFMSAKQTDRPFSRPQDFLPIGIATISLGMGYCFLNDIVALSYEKSNLPSQEINKEVVDVLEKTEVKGPLAKLLEFSCQDPEIIAEEMLGLEDIKNPATYAKLWLYERISIVQLLAARARDSLRLMVADGLYLQAKNSGLLSAKKIVDKAFGPGSSDGKYVLDQVIQRLMEGKENITEKVLNEIQQLKSFSSKYISESSKKLKNIPLMATTANGIPIDVLFEIAEDYGKCSRPASYIASVLPTLLVYRSLKANRNPIEDIYHLLFKEQELVDEDSGEDYSYLQFDNFYSPKGAQSDELCFEKELFNILPPEQQRYVIEKTFAIMVSLVRKSGQDAKLEAEVRSYIADSPELSAALSEDNTRALVNFLNSSSTKLLAKIMTTVALNKGNEAAIIREAIPLLSAPGAKFAQMLAQDAVVSKIPFWRDIFSIFLQGNPPPSVVDTFATLLKDETLRPEISGGTLVKTLGTGSMKVAYQVVNSNGDDLVLAVIKPGIIKQSQDVTDAIAACDPRFQEFAEHTRDTIIEEADARGDMESLAAIKESKAFRKLFDNGTLQAMNVIAFSKNGLLSQLTKGSTIASLDEEGKITPEVCEAYNQILLATMKAALKENKVFSDLHSGNLLCVVNEETGKVTLIVIDAGQYTQIKTSEKDLALSIAATLKTDLSILKYVLFKQLKKINKGVDSINEKLEKAYIHAAKEKEVRDAMTIFIAELKAQEVMIPSNVLSFCKMLDLSMQYNETFNFNSDPVNSAIVFFALRLPLKLFFS